MSPVGPFDMSRDARYLVAFGSEADVSQRFQSPSDRSKLIDLAPLPSRCDMN
jgi:hypothetical protein